MGRRRCTLAARGRAGRRAAPVICQRPSAIQSFSAHSTSRSAEVIRVLPLAAGAAEPPHKQRGHRLDRHRLAYPGSAAVPRSGGRRLVRSRRGRGSTPRRAARSPGRSRSIAQLPPGWPGRRLHGRPSCARVTEPVARRRTRSTARPTRRGPRRRATTSSSGSAAPSGADAGLRTAPGRRPRRGLPTGGAVSRVSLAIPSCVHVDPQVQGIVGRPADDCHWAFLFGRPSVPPRRGSRGLSPREIRGPCMRLEANRRVLVTRCRSMVVNGHTILAWM